MVDFDSLRSFDDWAGALDTLLADAERVIREGNNAGRTDVQRQLREFRRKSPPSPNLTRLDGIARKAVRDIAVQSVDEAITAIAERSNELDDLILQLRGVSATAQRHAKIINLETPTTIVASLTETVGALKELRDSFTPEVNAEEVAKRVESAIGAITKLRDAIEAAT